MKRIGTATWALALLAALPAAAQDQPNGDAATEPAAPQADEGERPEWKFTAGRYYARGGADGTDLNLRRRAGDTNCWLGYYEDADFGRSGRAGCDTRWALPVHAPLALLPSLQVASGGFIGGSLALEAGQDVFGQLGLGRTNLKPQVNLNFDPNDAITLALGWRPEHAPRYVATWVRDDRLHTGQQHLHLNGRWPLYDGQALTVDVLRKRGQGDAGFVRAWGASVTWDWPAWFLRAAYDPKQNFGPADVWRLSLGWRWH